MGKYYDIVLAHFANHMSSNFLVSWNVDKMPRENFLELVNWQEDVENIFDSRAEVMMRLFCLECDHHGMTESTLDFWTRCGMKRRGKLLSL
jgi:hypothetical protein